VIIATPPCPAFINAAVPQTQPKRLVFFEQGKFRGVLSVADIIGIKQ